MSVSTTSCPRRRTSVELLSLRTVFSTLGSLQTFMYALAQVFRGINRDPEFEEVERLCVTHMALPIMYAP
jgi:hypothetical protein